MYTAEKAKRQVEKLSSDKYVRKEVRKILRDIKDYSKRGITGCSFWIDNSTGTGVILELRRLGYKVAVLNHSIDVRWDE